MRVMENPCGWVPFQVLSVINLFSNNSATPIDGHVTDVVEGSVLFYSSRLAPVMSGSVFEVFRMGWSYKKDNISW